MSKKGRKQVPVTDLEIIDSRMEQIRYRRAGISLLTKIGITAVAVLLVLSFIFGIAIQRGENMYPRVRDGDIMFYFRIPTSLEIGDIITLMKDGTRYTGRIVARGGDSVDVSDEGKLMINGAIQYEEIYYETFTQGSPLTYPYIVPAESYFFLGDMRTGAKDSRDIGAVRKSEIDGKIIAIIRRRGL